MSPLYRRKDVISQLLPTLGQIKEIILLDLLSEMCDFPFISLFLALS